MNIPIISVLKTFDVLLTITLMRETYRKGIRIFIKRIGVQEKVCPTAGPNENLQDSSDLLLPSSHSKILIPTHVLICAHGSCPWGQTWTRKSGGHHRWVVFLVFFSNVISSSCSAVFVYSELTFCCKSFCEISRLTSWCQIRLKLNGSTPHSVWLHLRFFCCCVGSLRFSNFKIFQCDPGISSGYQNPWENGPSYLQVGATVTGSQRPNSIFGTAALKY